MPFKPYPLTPDEVTRADLMAMRIIMAVLVSALFRTHDNPDAAYREIEQAIGQLVAQFPLKAIPPHRHDAFRQAVMEHGKALLENARSLRRIEGPPH